jgi:maltooligosyltrehalose trehalohydrolase
MPGAASPSQSFASGLRRRVPVGAEYAGDGHTHLRVWAPHARTLDVVVNRRDRHALGGEIGGYFSGLIAAAPGDVYQFAVDSDEHLYPDPASRFQPDGPHGPSQVVDPAAFRWTDGRWRGTRLEGQIIYELHVGTFTRAGTWASAIGELPALADIGITTIEVMPVAEFDGRFGWGYDGVDLFAPSHLYGTPDDFRRFVDAAHGLGLAVLLDVVYNHFGPSGNYLRAFSPWYFTDKYDNEWGDAINFDGEHSESVRELFASNAAYWIDEFHLDGLRLDATQQIFDDSPEHILASVGKRARAAAGERSIVLVAENERQDARLVRPTADGGHGLDAVWNDDFHHSALVALTGRAEAYYSDTRGEPQEFVSAAKYGFLFQGQHYDWQRRPRGTPALDVEPKRFICFLQNHDQVANSAHGLRGAALTSPGRWRAMTTCLLLGPWTPMLFQGQEFAASAPFLYFADFDPKLAAAVRQGRGEFLTQFPSAVEVFDNGHLADPGDPRTFERCKVDWSERDAHGDAYALHRDLLRMRRDDDAFGRQQRSAVDGCVIAPHAFALRFFASDQRDDRVVIVNLGVDIDRHSIAEPLLAPPMNTDWALRWSSEDVQYGGRGTPELFPDGSWHLSGESAIVLQPGPKHPPRPLVLVRRSA